MPSNRGWAAKASGWPTPVNAPFQHSQFWIMATEPFGLTSRIVHSDRRIGSGLGDAHAPISTSVQFGYERTEDLIEVFQGKVKNAFTYARQGTPSTVALEALITHLEGGVGSVCFASGMAALSALFLTLLRAGDHLVSSAHGSATRIVSSAR
jgi:O-acetylhomoserine (thiol)-lyase